MKKILVCIFFIFQSFCANANEVANLNVKDFSLLLCLSNNYGKLNNFSFSRETNDASSLKEKYGPEDWEKIIKFIEENTSDYYKEIVIMHFDERPDKAMNIIFLKCMNFYHSKKMNEFIKRNKY